MHRCYQARNSCALSFKFCEAKLAACARLSPFCRISFCAPESRNNALHAACCNETLSRRQQAEHFSFRNSSIYGRSSIGEKCRFLFSQKPTAFVYSLRCPCAHVSLSGLTRESFRKMRKTFFLKHKTAFCGKLFFRWAGFRNLRFVVFSSGRKPHGAVCCFFVREETAFCGKLFFFWASFRILRFVIFLSGTKPHGAVFLLGIFKTAFCGLLQSEGFSYFGLIC